MGTQVEGWQLPPRKLVYLYVINYAKAGARVLSWVKWHRGMLQAQPDLAILAIHSFRKDCRWAQGFPQEIRKKAEGDQKRQWYWHLVGSDGFLSGMINTHEIRGRHHDLSIWKRIGLLALPTGHPKDSWMPAGRPPRSTTGRLDPSGICSAVAVNHGWAVVAPGCQRSQQPLVEGLGGRAPQRECEGPPLYVSIATHQPWGYHQWWI